MALIFEAFTDEELNLISGSSAPVDIRPQFGEYVKLSIYDKDNNLIEESTNDEDVETSFIIPTNIVPTQGCRIKVSNAFGDELMNSKVLLKKAN